MNRRGWLMVFCTVILFVAGGCSKKGYGPDLIVEIPSGYTGNFLMEMGIKDAPALAKQGNSYVVAVPRSGRMTTSTLLMNPQPIFKNSSEGAVWGYSHSVSATGDGIPVGGKIEFFVGTRKEYEAEQNKKNHSEGFPTQPDSATSGA